MTDETTKKTPTIYTIKIKGELDESWTEWFEPMAITHTDEGDTVLKGELADQSALQGLLVNLGNLNLELISVNPIAEDSDPATEENDS